MSRSTLNSLQYLVMTNELSKSRQNLMGLAIENARQSASSHRDFAQESTRLQIENIRKASPETAKNITMQHAKIDINKHMEEAGIDPEKFNRNQKSQLKWAALFVVTHRQDINFSDILANAKPNLEKSSRLGSDSIDESILHSMAFKDGKSWGVEPDISHIAQSVAQNPVATKNMNALVDAHDLYLESQRNKSTIRSKIEDFSRGVKDITKASAKIATVGLVVGALALSATQAVKIFDNNMDNIYSASNTEFVVNPQESVSVKDYSVRTLIAMGLPTDQDSVNKHLAASGYSPDDIAKPGDEIRLVVPENVSDSHVYNLNQVGSVERNGEKIEKSPLVFPPGSDFVMTSARG